MRKALFL